ncbi:unnamed protein product, partial [Iphiclides podalirius]
MRSITPLHSSTLTPMHLRKAKLMFFWVRYPSSAVLKMYFPDIKFNKNNTAQLVKWFSNFRPPIRGTYHKPRAPMISDSPSFAICVFVVAHSEHSIRPRRDSRSYRRLENTPPSASLKGYPAGGARAGLSGAGGGQLQAEASAHLNN